jgi:hypothetical protein
MLPCWQLSEVLTIKTLQCSRKFQDRKFPVLEGRSPSCHVAAAMPVVPPALWSAASDGLMEEVRQLIAEGADIEEKGGEGETRELKTTPLVESS